MTSRLIASSFFWSLFLFSAASTQSSTHWDIDLPLFLYRSPCPTPSPFVCLIFSIGLWVWSSSRWGRLWTIVISRTVTRCLFFFFAPHFLLLHLMLLMLLFSFAIIYFFIVQWVNKFFCCYCATYCYCCSCCCCRYPPSTFCGSRNPAKCLAAIYHYRDLWSRRRLILFCLFSFFTIQFYASNTLIKRN